MNDEDVGVTEVSEEVRRLVRVAVEAQMAKQSSHLTDDPDSDETTRLMNRRINAASMVAALATEFVATDAPAEADLKRCVMHALAQAIATALLPVHCCTLHSSMNVGLVAQDAINMLRSVGRAVDEMEASDGVGRPAGSC